MTFGNSHKVFVIALISLFISNVCRGCDEWHKVQVTINEWHGDLNVITDLSHNGVDLNLLFGEYTDLRHNDTINVTNDVINIQLLAEYDEYDSPVLYGIVINGVNICDKIGDRAVNFKSPSFQPQPQSQPPESIVTEAPAPVVVETPNYENYEAIYTIPDECGITIPEITPYIHHGTQATVSEFPWHAVLFDMPRYKYRCGGSLISRDLVVTAAHCVTKGQSSSPIPNSSIIVILGKDQLQTSSIIEQKSAISEIHVHRSFDSNNFNNDIAVIKLMTRMQYTNFVRPVCIWPYSNDHIYSIVDKYGLIPGFGYNEYWNLPDQLTSIKMPVVSYEICLASRRDFYARVISESNFCAGSRNGSSVCNGDSGGGMVFKINSLYYLRGIVSIGPSDENVRTRCDPNYYIVFTDVAKYVEWLRQF